MTEEINKIEIRSEEVDEIMGKSPAWIIRWGITVIFLVIATLLIGSYFFKYPDITRASFIIIKAKTAPEKDSIYICRIKVPANSINKVKVNQTVNLKFEQYPYMEFGIIQSEISRIDTVPVNDFSGTFYITEVSLGNRLFTNYNHQLNLTYGLSGNAEIITNNKRLIYQFFNPIISIFY